MAAAALEALLTSSDMVGSPPNSGLQGYGEFPLFVNENKGLRRDFAGEG